MSEQWRQCMGRTVGLQRTYCKTCYTGWISQWQISLFVLSVSSHECPAELNSRLITKPHRCRFLSIY